MTDAGNLLATSGAVIDDLCGDAERRMRSQLPRLAARVRIGTFQSAAQHLLPPAVTALRHRQAEAVITIREINSEQGPDLVANGALDLAVVSDYRGRPMTPPGVAVHRLLEDPLVVCLPDDHPLVVSTEPHQPIRLTQLRHQNWIAILPGHPARIQFDAAAASASLDATVVMETENYNVAQSLVATGIANTLLSRLTVTTTPGATHRTLARPRLARGIYAITSQDTRHAPLVKTTLALLQDVANELASNWRRPV